MELAYLRTSALHVLLLLVATINIQKSCCGILNTLQNAQINSITRLNLGDIFTAKGTECNPDTCVGLSSGTATFAPAEALEGHPAPRDFCTCQCLRHLPAFREDLHICVDDIHECVLAPFVSGATSQQIPFVFLPLKGQIIHPSKEISFAGIQTPVCAVSGAKFLTENGWIDLRNPLDTDVPFRLFRDEGRTFLQWIGEPDLRARMSGRLVLVHLMCRELATVEPVRPNVQSIFAPCVAFRVAGSPIKYLSNVSEVVFSPGAHSSENGSNGMSISEYVAIGICSVLLGLIYVASVFLYLHLRKRRKNNEKILDRRDNQSINGAEEGVIKKNPLLALGRRFALPDGPFNDSTSSDNDITPDVVQNQDDRKMKVQITSALVHPQHFKSAFTSMSPYDSSSHSDNSSIEKLPEENVSIVETIEGRDEGLDSIRAISGSTRRKLYFNPAYFEPHLLVAPPPAAIEFLIKIREVISIAKQKMATKRFMPSLMGIPEEDPQYSLESSSKHSHQIVSRRSSLISLKRENSRRRACSGCPGCEPRDLKSFCGKLPEFPSLAACQSCTTTPESKQKSIRKWLENIPVVESKVFGVNTRSLKAMEKRKRIRSPTRSLPPVPIPSSPVRTLSPKPSSERARSPSIKDECRSISSIKSSGSGSSNGKSTPSRRRMICKPKTPPPPIPTAKMKSIEMEKIDNEMEHAYDTVSNDYDNLPPPDMIHEAMVVDKVDEIKIPTITKRKMNAVINEFAVQRGLNRSNQSVTKAVVETNHQQQQQQHQPIDYDTDSLERNGRNKGYSTPTDYGDVTSSHPSPSLSSALPMDEEMTMRNAIFNTKTGNMTISKLNMDLFQNDDHDYELIVLRKGDRTSMGKCNIYDLPELLHRNNGYSLVSEVYVNNGYNYNSAPSTPSQSSCSTLESRPKIRYDQPESKPGHLLIEVEDCPDNYIRVEDSDSFEPDTLDRKPSKLKLSKSPCENVDDFIDSLERPSSQIRLRTTGSFKKSNSLHQIQQALNGNFNRNFGSLREIYEAKTKSSMKNNLNNSFRSCHSDQVKTSWPRPAGFTKKEEEGRILTLEERHSKRQRQLLNLNKDCVVVPPDVIPPPPHDNSPIYEQPKPPRKVVVDGRPPLPQKNGKGRSTGSNKMGVTTSTPCCQNLVSCGASASSGPNCSDRPSPGDAQNVQKNAKVITSDDSKIVYSKKEERSPKNDMVICITDKPEVNHKTEDSGYLSTDSNESRMKKYSDVDMSVGCGSETDESLGDGHSESGAESVETHSVFFGSYAKTPRMAIFDISDYKSGDITNITVIAENDNTDSETTVSYDTVVPIRKDSFRKPLIVEE